MIFVLKLINNKYYLGITDKKNFKIEDYLRINDTIWTILYKPIRVIEVINEDDINIDKYVHLYMNNYGVNNVRGGSYKRHHLTEDNIKSLKDLIENCKDKCYICGLRGHYPSMCYMTIETYDETNIQVIEEEYGGIYF